MTQLLNSALSGPVIEMGVWWRSDPVEVGSDPVEEVESDPAEEVESDPVEEVESDPAEEISDGVDEGTEAAAMSSAVDRGVKGDV